MRKRVRETPTPDPRLHFLPEPALHGKRNKALRRGTLISDRHGHTYYNIIRKTVADTEIPAVTEQLVKEGPKKGWYFQGAFKDPQLFQNWPSLLETLRAAPHRNVLHVLEWQRQPLAAAGRPPLYHIYTPVCVGGTLANVLEAAQREHEPLWYRDFRVLRRHFMHGAWQGLRHLNDTLGLLHYDLKRAIIFVHQDSATSPPHVVLGDIDGVVQRIACYDGVHPIGTVCYGSPFPSCDWRGDAVPMALCTFLIVWNVLPSNTQGFNERALPHYDWWFTHCHNQLLQQLPHPSLAEYWGWVPPTVLTHAWSDVLNDQGKPGAPTPIRVYGLFADQIRHRVPPRELGNFADMLQALDDPAEQAARLWPDNLPWLFNHFEDWLRYDPDSLDHVQQWQGWFAAYNARSKASQAQMEEEHPPSPPAKLQRPSWSLFGLFGGRKTFSLS